MNKSLWLVLLALVSESALAENPSKQAFKAAYKKYNDCIEKQDKDCAIEQADIALRYGLQLFDTQGKNVAMLTHNYGLALLKSDSADKRLASYPVLKEAYQRIRHAFGAKSENAVLVLLDLCGSVALQPKEEQLSQTYIEDTISISENVYGADSLAHARLLQRLAKSSMESPALSWDE